MAISGPDGAHRAPMSEINVTPMVDVMLVLLVIFMVAAPLLNASVDVDLPNAEAPEIPVDREMLLLSIDDEERVFIRLTGTEDADAAEPVQLPYTTPEELREALQTHPRIVNAEEIFIQGDENARYGFVARVLAMVRRAGVQRVGLVTDPRAERTDR